MMRILLLLLCTHIASSIVSAQSFSLGSAFIYGDDIKESGIQVRGYYNLKNNKVCFGPEFSQFIAHKESINGEEISRRLQEINFNIHYVFEIREEWGVYPLIGLNISTEKEEITLTSGEIDKERKNAFGTNLGIGIHKPVNKWIFFTEYDYLISDLSQNSFLIGPFFTFGKRTEHE